MKDVSVSSFYEPLDSGLLAATRRLHDLSPFLSAFYQEQMRHLITFNPEVF